MLVVDDERDVADILAAVLETLGQDVAVAYDARSALALARQHRPEVAFLDVTMPDVSGSELARWLRDEFRAGQLILVAVTGHERSHGRVEGRAFDHHLLKPATVETVAAVLHTTARDDGRTRP